MLLTSIIIIQNNESSIVLLKYLSQRDSDIEDAENIEVLLFMSVYMSSSFSVNMCEAATSPVKVGQEANSTTYNIDINGLIGSV